MNKLGYTEGFSYIVEIDETAYDDMKRLAYNLKLALGWDRQDWADTSWQQFQGFTAFVSALAELSPEQLEIMIKELVNSEPQKTKKFSKLFRPYE